MSVTHSFHYDLLAPGQRRCISVELYSPYYRHFLQARKLLSHRSFDLLAVLCYNTCDR